MTRAELRTLTARLCEDPNQTKFTADKYNDALTKAENQFAMDSKALYKDSSITMVLSTASYDLPTDFMLEKEVTLNGIELAPISRATLQANKKSDKWSDDAGTPRYYVIDPEEARKTITLYPIPDSVNDGTDLVLTYYVFPTPMTGDTSVPLNSSALMVQFHMGLAAYAAWLLLMYLQQSSEISRKRSELFGIYNTKVGEAIQTFGNTKSEPLSFHVENIRVR